MAWGQRGAGETQMAPVTSAPSGLCSGLWLRLAWYAGLQTLSCAHPVCREAGHCQAAVANREGADCSRSAVPGAQHRLGLSQLRAEGKAWRPHGCPFLSRVTALRGGQLPAGALGAALSWSAACACMRVG